MITAAWDRTEIDAVDFYPGMGILAPRMVWHADDEVRLFPLIAQEPVEHQRRYQA